jgi:hypothetical protein
MSDFWETFTGGADAAIETMGEAVTIGGQAMRAVVQPAGTRPEITPGGISSGVTHLLQVSLADGAWVVDGVKVVSRLLTGAVIRKEHFGGGWMIHAGPANRWNGEV